MAWLNLREEIEEEFFIEDRVEERTEEAIFYCLAKLQAQRREIQQRYEDRVRICRPKAQRKENKQDRKKYQAEWYQKKIAAESGSPLKEKRLEERRLKWKMKVSSETPEERAIRLEKSRKNQAAWRRNWTPEKRESERRRVAEYEKKRGKRAIPKAAE